MRHLSPLLLTAGLVVAVSVSALAGQKPPAAAPGSKAGSIKACSLVTRAEVKKLLPWAPHVDQLPEEEQPIGSTGSSCAYPTVVIQVLQGSSGMIEAAKKQDELEAVPGLGEEAYFRNNKNRYAEVFVKTGNYVVTLQGDVPTGKTPESIKPSVVALARLLVEKLR